MSYKAKTFDKSFNGGKMCIINIAKALCHTNQQLKALNKLLLYKYISEHKYGHYVNSCKFIDNKWSFNNKNVFTAISIS